MQNESMFDEEALAGLLGRVADGTTPPAEALEALRGLPFEDVGFAKLDHHRSLRESIAEVVFCAPKTEAQVAEIVGRLAGRHDRVLGTRATVEQYEAARRRVPALRYDALARCLWLDRRPGEGQCEGVVLVAAGTGDLPVAEEAALTLRLMGHEPRRIYDVGVAGLHRLLAHLPAIQGADVVVVAAGMEGALPSVVAGLTGAPVVAVPTSVGYGASFGGLAALLGMLNSCAAGMAVVNIDNGYGAGHMAATIHRAMLRGVGKKAPAGSSNGSMRPRDKGVHGNGHPAGATAEPEGLKGSVRDGEVDAPGAEGQPVRAMGRMEAL